MGVLIIVIVVLGVIGQQLFGGAFHHVCVWQGDNSTAVTAAEELGGSFRNGQSFGFTPIVTPQPHHHQRPPSRFRTYDDNSNGETGSPSTGNPQEEERIRQLKEADDEEDALYCGDATYGQCPD